MSFDETKQVSKIILPNEIGTLRQELAVDNMDNVLLRSSYDDEEVAKRNYEIRKENPRGFNSTGTSKHKAGIPYYEFLYQPLLRDFTVYLHFKDEVNARKCMDKFLEQNPQYKTSS